VEEASAYHTKDEISDIVTVVIVSEIYLGIMIIGMMLGGIW
jgi:hypothetical protein